MDLNSFSCKHFVPTSLENLYSDVGRFLVIEYVSLTTRVPRNHYYSKTCIQLQMYILRVAKPRAVQIMRDET